MRIIPAIDVIDGKCVRLTQGNYSSKKIYNENPVEVAKQFEDNGLKYLHLVDLDGAKGGHVKNWKVIDAITSSTKLLVDFGGGVKSDEEIQMLVDLGVSQINLGSIAVNRPYKVYEWVEKFGKDKIILSADVRNNKIAVHGWQENSSIEIEDFIDGFHLQGLAYVACTDIEVDGMLSGPNVDLYANIMKKFPELKLIASGGVGTLKHIDDLDKVALDGVIVGKAIYENKITLEQLGNFKSS